MHMWRRTGQLMVVMVVACLPFAVAAVNFFGHEETVRIEDTRKLTDDTYIVGGEVVVRGDVEGDLVVAGGQVRVEGDVTQDLMVVGGQVELQGKVADDVRVAGGQIRINGTVVDDVLVGGGDIALEEGSKVGEVWAAGGRVTLSGEAAAVHAATDSLVLTESAVVLGDVRYFSEVDAQIAEGARVGGVIERKEAPASASTHDSGVWMSLWSALTSVVLGLLFIYFMPRKAERVADTWRMQFGSNLLWGAAFLVGVPLAVVLLFVTVIGWPLAVGMLLTYPIFLYLGKIVSVVGLGSWLMQRWQKQQAARVDWLAVVFGALAVFILGLIPVAGWLAVFIFCLSGLGALLKFDITLLRRLRSDGTL